MKKTLWVCICLTLMLVAKTHKVEQEKISDIQSTVEEVVAFYSQEMNNTAVLLLVEKEGKRYKAAAGLADRESQRKVYMDDLFEIGSATKVFTGVAIFQLIEEGKLSLETKLSTFYKEGEIRKLANYEGKNYWSEVTVGMLMGHTSGFIDYLNVYNDDAKALKILGGKGKHFTFDQLIHQAVAFGDANFKPGERHEYCNTGFVILGDIISKVSGMDWHDYVQKHILDRVGMKHTYFGSRIPSALREKMPKGYMAYKEVFMPPSLADSAGEIISTVDDLAAFMKAWAGGKLYAKKETLQFQLTQGFHQHYKTVKSILYGYAIMKIEGFYGHGGQTFGFQTYMTINPTNSNLYIVGVNDSTVGAMNFFTSLERIEVK